MNPKYKLTAVYLERQRVDSSTTPFYDCMHDATWKFVYGLHEKKVEQKTNKNCSCSVLINRTASKVNKNCSCSVLINRTAVVYFPFYIF